MQQHPPDLLLLFDIDGTLVNVRPGLSKTVFFETLGGLHRLEEIVVEEGYTFHGRTDRSIYADVCRFNGVDDRQRLGREDEFIALLVERWGIELEPQSVQVLDGVHDLLSRLESESWGLLSLLTGNVEAGARAKLEPHRLFDRFTAGAFGCDSADRNALPPIAIDRISSLTGWRYRPETSVIIGDSPRDIECARVNGLHVIAVATGGAPIDELEEHRPDLLLDSLRDTERILQFLQTIRP